MLFHVGRDRSGRRRLEEVAVLHRGAGERVGVRTVWHADRPVPAATTALPPQLGAVLNGGGP